MREEDGSSFDGLGAGGLHEGCQHAGEYHADPSSLEADLSGTLPTNLWSDDIEIPSLVDKAQTGLDQGNAFTGNFRERMNQDEKKQAALKTIAGLQEWATVNKGGRTTSMVSENGDMTDSRRAAWHAMMQQQTLLQQQQQKIQQAAALQRIIQDYLNGKQLTLIEQQILQQYIRQQQGQHFQQPYASNDIHGAGPYQLPQHVNHQRYQIPDHDHLSRTYHERLSMAAAGANPSMQARRNQAHIDAVLAVQQQQNLARQNHYGPTADPRYAPSHYHADGATPWARPGLQAQPMGGYRGGVSSNGQQYHVPTRKTAPEPGMYRQHGAAPAPVRPAAAAATGLRQDGITNPVETLRDIGKTLYHLGITVEGAVNAGLLGGLSASDVRIVLESYRIETELHSFIPNASSHNTSPSIPSAPRAPHVSVPQNTRLERARSGSFGNLSAPTPSSPAWSAGAASTGSLPLHVGSTMQKSPKSKGTSVADDDSSDSLLDQLIESSTTAAVASKTEVTQISEAKDSLFDASQYGFFESVSKIDQNSGGVLEGDTDNDGPSHGEIEDSGLLNYLNGLKLGTDFS